MKHSVKTRASNFIKEKAQEMGFLAVGIAKAEFLEREAPQLESWLNKGLQGNMSYLSNHFDLRLDVSKLVPGAKSVIVLLYNYFPEKEIPSEENFKVSKYAYGRDYHKVIRKKLKALLREFREEFGDIHGRGFVDSAPVMERAWAKRAGLGWIGKNSLLLNKRAGSFFFISELIVDIELEYDSPVSDHCGTCTACIDACPTDAIIQPEVIDSKKCISYLTIELKEQIPKEFSGKMEDWIYGCDICQDVCPWNRFSSPHQEEDFLPSEFLKLTRKPEWREITREIFEKEFMGSAIKRTKYEGLKRNIAFADKGSKEN